MGLFNWLSSFLSDDASSIKYDAFEDDSFTSQDSSLDAHAINPANGLPMTGGLGGVDIEGNPYGTDLVMIYIQVGVP
jgi:hypothetical protein